MTLRERYTRHMRRWRARQRYAKRWAGWSLTDICEATGLYLSPPSSLQPGRGWRVTGLYGVLAKSGRKAPG